MKKKHTILIVIASILLFSSCRKDFPRQMAISIISETYTSNSATFVLNVADLGGNKSVEYGICYSASNTLPTIDDSKQMKTTDAAGTYTIEITNLTPFTAAFVFRAFIKADNEVVYRDTKTVAVGDSYQGGIVAYIFQPGDPGYIAGQLHGLIAAPYDQSTSAIWGCGGTAISGADGTAIGTGYQNTVDIMNGCTTAGIAARLCGDLVLGGYNDWYLPSKDELNKLYLNRFVIGGFVSAYYRSSSECAGYETSDAWTQDFAYGYQYYQGKDDALYVRAVRAF